MVSGLNQNNLKTRQHCGCKSMSRKAKHFDSSAKGAHKEAVTQAQRIVARFGGASRLARILQEIGQPLAVQTIYRWLYPDRSGLIPAHQVEKIMSAARHAGVRLTDGDWSPVEDDEMNADLQGEYRVIHVRRAGSGEPCTIEIREAEGELILRTVDKSGVTTLSAIVSTDAARELHRALGRFLDPISG